MENVIKYIDGQSEEDIIMSIKLLNGKGKSVKSLMKLINFDIMKNHKEYYDSLKEEEKKAVNLFQSHNFPLKNNFKIMYLNFEQRQELSELLDKNKSLEIKKFVSEMKKKFGQDRRLLKKVIKNAPRSEKQFYIFRGLYHKREKSYNKKIMNYKVGDRYHMKDFESFSINPLVAINFLGDDFCCILRIKMTPKIKALYLFGISKSYDHELEVLLSKQPMEISKIWKLEHPYDSEYYNIKVLDLKLSD